MSDKVIHVAVDSKFRSCPLWIEESDSCVAANGECYCREPAPRWCPLRTGVVAIKAKA